MENDKITDVSVYIAGIQRIGSQLMKFTNP